MGRTTKWLFSTSISLAFVAGSGCIPANAQANQIRGWFSEASNYVGLVEGQGNNNYGDSMQINLLHECYANPGSCGLSGNADSSFTPLKDFWNVGNTGATDSKFDIEKFKTTGGKPGLSLYGNWDEYFKESDGDIVEVRGRMKEFKSILNQNALFSDVELNCAGDGCIELKGANPGGVSIDFRNSVSNQGTDRDFYIGLANPALIEEIGGGEEGSGGSSCFQEVGSGVKVPEEKTCSTDDEKFSSEYTSLKVEDQGKLNLGGNLILQESFTSFEVQNNALVEGSGGLVKTGPQTTVLKGTGTFTYEGDVYVQGGVLDIQNPTALGSVSGETLIEDGSLQLSLTGSKKTNGNYAQIVLNEPLTVDGGTIIFPGNERPNGDSSDDLGSNITLKGPIQISEKGATFQTSIRQISGDGTRRAKVSAKVSGEGDFQKSGEGVLLIHDADLSKFSGDFIISEGLLALGQDNVIPKTANVDIKQGSKVTMYSQTMNQNIASLVGKGEWTMFYEGQELRIGNDIASNKFEGRITGKGSLVKDGTNTLLLSGANTYEGATTINAGTLRVGGSLSDSTAVSVTDGATYQVEASDTIGSLEGAGSIELADGVTLTAGGLNTDTEVSGVISGVGVFTKVGDGITTFSGVNTYKGETNVEEGRLTLANGSAIDRSSQTIVSGGHLDLYTYSANSSIDDGKAFEIDQVDISDGGQLTVSARNPLVSENINLNASSGGITVEVFEKTVGREMNKAPIRVSDKFTYIDGSLTVRAPLSDDPEGTWNIIDGEVENAEQLAKKTYLVTSNRSTYKFEGVDKPIYGPAMYKGYLEKGSLNLVIEPKTSEELQCELDTADCLIDLPSPDPGNPGNELPVELPSPEGPQAGNEPPDLDGDGIPDVIDPDADGNGELDQLPGCETDSDLCDIISDIDGDEDDAPVQEEELADDVIDGLLDGLAEEEIDLPLSFDYGQLAKLVVSGLLPRNVDAPGRSLFNYNNLMVDTIFERLPLRQFKAVEVAEDIEEEAVMVEPEAVAPAEPIRGLWSQTEGMDEQQAQEYLAQRVAQGDQVVVEGVDFELDGIGYVEDPSLTGQYANRDGVRAWYKAFGGDLGPTTTSTLYGNYNASASGMVVGADVSLGSNVQIGVFGNYGDVNLYQYSGDTGSGSWNPTGWGGGITADWWSENFYVQGLISASSFSGNQKRNIIAINEQLGNETARGDKNVTSYSYALRLGAPFEAGRLLLEPQFTAAWTQNQESGFTENGADRLNLRYGSRTTNFLQTELGMKFALPIQSGERGEWVPNLRVAWLGDWNQNNEDQSIGYAFTDKTVGVAPLEDNQNGVLIEGGLDYTMANINNGSWKLYVRGGAEVWGGERGTDWRASGGMTWQF